MNDREFVEHMRRMEVGVTTTVVLLAVFIVATVLVALWGVMTCVK